MLLGNTNWIDILQDVIDDYNSTYHRTIKMKPVDVTRENENLVYNRSYRHILINNRPIKFKLGEYVRISKYKRLFEKDHTSSYSAEVFQVYKIKKTVPTTYILKDLAGNEIKGGFYEQELQSTKHKDVYLVEKILKQSANKAKSLVKFFGFPKPEWINTKDII